MNFGGKEYKFAVILPWIGKVVRHYKLKMCLNVVLGWTVVGLNFLFVWTTKNAIDMATVYHNQWALRFACAMLVVIIIFQAVISAINRRLKTLLSFNMNRRMQEHLFHHAVSANWKDINEYHTGDIVRRFEEDGTEIISFVNGTIPTILLVLLQLGGAYVFLFVLSKDIAIALAVIMVLGIVISKFHFLKIRSFSAKIKECGSRLQAALQEGVQNISVLKALTGQNLFAKYYSGIFDIQKSNIKRRLTYSAVLNLGFAACYLFVFIWGVLNLETGAITYGTLMAFVQLTGQIQGPSRTLINSISDFAEFYTSCERLNEIDSINSEKSTGKSGPFSGVPGICCENISYRYSDNKRTVINNFSHTFKPGTMSAIVGTTGAGKTTLIRLLLSYVSPCSGHTYIICGNDKREISADTRCAFAYVPQGNTILSGTIAENMRMVKEDATDEEIIEALKISCAWDFVQHLPDTINSRVGERGRGFSEGQSQRLAIARAVLRDAPVLLLDEATSALDVTTERNVLRNIIRQRPNKTCIVTTHRPSVLGLCQRVYRVMNGTVTELDGAEGAKMVEDF